VLYDSPVGHSTRYLHLKATNQCSFCYRKSLAIPPNEEKSGYDKCRMYAVNLTEMWDKGITEGDSSWPTVDCRHGWEFNYTDIPYSTIASEVRK